MYYHFHLQNLVLDLCLEYYLPLQLCCKLLHHLNHLHLEYRIPNYLRRRRRQQMI
jgi:hypothetical protein